MAVAALKCRNVEAKMNNVLDVEEDASFSFGTFNAGGRPAGISAPASDDGHAGFRSRVKYNVKISSEFSICMYIYYMKYMKYIYIYIYIYLYVYIYIIIYR